MLLKNLYTKKLQPPASGSPEYQKWVYEIENDANCDDAREMHGQKMRRANCPVHCGFILPPSKAPDNDTVFARQREWRR